jgi:two-component system, LytTR family, sensor kinase
VPSMLLQPLIENSIKHGLARKVGGGRITIKALARDGHTIIEVHDDGLGMSEERLGHALSDGIGLSNVNERLRTIYGANYHLKLRSVSGVGTCASIEIPDLVLPERVTA